MCAAEHLFNDDLLLRQDDRKVAQHQFGSAYALLDFKPLRDEFERRDAIANAAKRRGYRIGMLVIILGMAALAVAACEHVIEPGSEMYDEWIRTHVPWAGSVPSVSVVLAVAAGLMGIISVFLGAMGLLTARRKRDWLQQRFATERLRQFHFQAFAVRPECLTALTNEKARGDWLAQRDIWFQAFKTRVLHKLAAEFSATIEDEDGDKAWLHEKVEPPPGLDKWLQTGELFRAYRALRIEAQIGYANYKLQNDAKLFSSFARRQSQVLSGASLLLILLLLLIHVGVIAGAVAHGPFWDGFRSEAVNVIVVWIAIAALGLRALEAGLQPEREVERYERYRSAVRGILRRFDAAGPTHEKLAVMAEMERLAYEEMRTFLITGQRSRFIL